MEGPSIVILKEQAHAFIGETVLRVEGNSKIDQSIFINQPVKDIKSWGKHFLVCFPSFTLCVHFLMFGSYRINERKEASPRLSLQFADGELNFYSCSIKIINEDLDKVYDWDVDVLSATWDAKKAGKALKQMPHAMVCDVLLDQSIFAGAGNIIKNEVLFRIKMHPETKLEALSQRQLFAVIRATAEYSLDFYKWKKIFELKKHWQVYNKKICPRCNIPVIKKHTGETNRRSFYCENCQVLYLK